MIPTVSSNFRLSQKKNLYCNYLKYYSLWFLSIHSTVNYDQADMLTSTVPLYNYLIDGAYGLDILIYSGDDDSVCGTVGTQNWVSEIKTGIYLCWEKKIYLTFILIKAILYCIYRYVLTLTWIFIFLDLESRIPNFFKMETILC